MLNQPKTAVHFIAKELANPVHPITVNLIGAGGTGSHLLAQLADTAYVLLQCGHPGFFVQCFDAETISQPNVARGRFSPAEIGINKAVALINRANRTYGFDWRAVPEHFGENMLQYNYTSQVPHAMITISCVDEVKPRHLIAKILKASNKEYMAPHHKPLYWLDCGNSTFTGQAILSTVKPIEQPKVKPYSVVSTLPMITDEFGHLLIDVPSQPSCSTMEAIASQDLFINREVATSAMRLLWQLLRNQSTTCRGIFTNLLTNEQRPLPVKVLPKVKKRKQPQLETSA